MDIVAEKRRLRRLVRKRILAMDSLERARQEAALRCAVEGLPGFAEARTVLLYAACFPEEIQTEPIALRAQELGKQLVYPRVDGVARRLTLHPVNDLVADFRPGALAIPEPRPELPEWLPSAVDWVLVPIIWVGSVSPALTCPPGGTITLVCKTGSIVPICKTGTIECCE